MSSTMSSNTPNTELAITAQRSVDAPAMVSDVASRFRVLQFSDKFMDLTLHFLVLVMDQSLFLWIGNTAKELNSLHLCVPSRMVRFALMC